MIGSQKNDTKKNALPRTAWCALPHLTQHLVVAISYFQVKNLLTGCNWFSYAFSFGIPNYIHKAPVIIEGNLCCLDV